MHLSTKPEPINKIKITHKPESTKENLRKISHRRKSLERKDVILWWILIVDFLNREIIGHSQHLFTYVNNRYE